MKNKPVNIEKENIENTVKTEEQNTKSIVKIEEQNTKKAAKAEEQDIEKTAKAEEQDIEKTAKAEEQDIENAAKPEMQSAEKIEKNDKEKKGNNDKKGNRVLIYVMYIIVPLLLNIFLETCNRKSLIKAFGFAVKNPAMLFYGCLIVFFTLIFSLFFKKRTFMFCFITLIWIVFGITDFLLLTFRVTPFSAVDFMLIISAIDVADHYFTIPQLIGLIIAAIAAIVGLVFLYRKSKSVKIKSKMYYVHTTILVVMVGLLLFFFAQFPPVSTLRDNYTNITEVYEKYGFVFCFADSLVDSGIEKPESYSNEAIDTLLAQIDDEKSVTEKPNIIFVQLESFFDVNEIEGLEFSKDPLPNFHKLQNEYTSGYITVPTVGAGTVNTEFEILTGMNQQDFGTSEYPYKTKLKNTSCESICYDVKKLGYSCHVVHNNTAKFYGRDKVFSNLGFDTFQSVEFMRNVTRNPNGWANDYVMTDEIIDSLDSTEGTDFTMAITVQSHGKYDIPDYENKHVTVTGAPEGMEGQFNYFVDQCYEVDQMIGELVRALENRDEKTIVMFYGDHLPSLGLTKENLGNGSIYQTEYVIWDNFGLKDRHRDIKSFQMYPYVLNLIGIHEGIITKFHQQYDWNAPDYMSCLQELEYDFLYGKQYIYGDENPFIPTELQLGTHQIKLNEVVNNNGIYYAHGDYISDNTVVYFNGKKLDSTVVSSGIVEISGEIVYDEDAQLKYDEMTDEEKAEIEEPNCFKLVVENSSETALAESNTVKIDDLKNTEQ